MLKIVKTSWAKQKREEIERITKFRKQNFKRLKLEALHSHTSRQSSLVSIHKTISTSTIFWVASIHLLLASSRTWKCWIVVHCILPLILVWNTGFDPSCSRSTSWTSLHTLLCYVPFDVFIFHFYMSLSLLLLDRSSLCMALLHFSQQNE